MVKFFQKNFQKIPDNSIVNDIEKAKNELYCAYSNFEHALEPDLIDCYIYQLQSAQLRYKFLLNCAKKEAVKNKIFEV